MDILAILRKRRAELMPSSQDVVNETCRRLGYFAGSVKPDDVRHNFNNMLRQLFEHTLVVLEEHERDVDADQILPQFVEMRKDDIERERAAMRREGDDAGALQRTVGRLLKNWHEPLRGIFLSVSQSRKQRGGKDFEYQIQRLLQLAEIPHEVQTRRERADFILPSAEVLAENRPRAVLISAKRTLRERWQEVVDELQKISCPNTYLATADEGFSHGVVVEIKKRNIYLVTWDHIKNDKFPSEPTVVSYSQLINDLVTHFMPRW